MKLKQSRSGQYTLTVPVTVAVSEKTAKALKLTTGLSGYLTSVRASLVDAAMNQPDDLKLEAPLFALRTELADTISTINAILSN